MLEKLEYICWQLDWHWSLEVAGELKKAGLDFKQCMTQINSNLKRMIVKNGVRTIGEANIKFCICYTDILVLMIWLDYCYGSFMYNLIIILLNCFGELHGEKCNLLFVAPYP